MKTRRSAPTLEIRPVVAHRLLLMFLRSPLGRMFGGVCELQFVGRVTGRRVSLPVQFARDEQRLVIYVAGSTGKQWWRNFVGGHEVLVRIGDSIRPGHGRVLEFEHPERAAAEQLYRSKYSKIAVGRADPLIAIDLSP